ncbi:sugar transferase [Weissella confusa]|uniref:sugar transferase n=1 Tax=Weissella confusa TaxID=1583 RepID=UPI00223A7015|nr:sugar transferase [Weissella confusa]
MKRLIDVIGSIVGLVVLTPTMLVIMLLIKLEDKGPVFYGQTRIGKNGAEFKMWKFRSMRENADELRSQMMAQNDADGPMFKIKDDPRVTKIGHFIRKKSLDETPQFFNVLKGEMSLVGPRPSLPVEVIEFDSRERERLNVLPGLTGLWQVSGRNDLSFDDMIALDLEYVKHHSVLWDIKIIFITVAQIFFSKGNGAY